MRRAQATPMRGNNKHGESMYPDADALHTARDL